ncbi:MAG: hypothetical protein EOP00_11625 [Pedobacter sp.]|nr:MAG: hypothetical protein EOP00_11625 [Pedobacter sp.]
MENTAVHQVTLNVRIATAEDFTNEQNTQKYGAVFLHQSSTGDIEQELHIFSPATDMKTFKSLYKRQQIFVPMGIFELKNLNDK